MKARLRWLLGLPLRPFAPAWALRRPETLRWGGLRVALFLSAALGALIAVVWVPGTLEALGHAHPALRRLLPAGDTARATMAFVLAIPLFVAAALQVSAARRVPAHLRDRTLAEQAAAVGRPVGPALRWALPLWSLAALLVALNLALYGLLMISGALGVLAILGAVSQCGVQGQDWDTFSQHVAAIWDLANAPAEIFSAEIKVLDGTLMDPIWGMLLFFAVFFVAPTAVAVWTLRRMRADEP